MLNNRLMARSAPVTSVGAPRALGARPSSSLQRASVRARSSAQPSPPPQQTGKARLTSAGLHIGSLHIGTIGTLNLHMSPSNPVAATAAAPAASALPARASNQAPAAPPVAALPPLPLPNPSAPTSPYTCIAVLEPVSSSTTDLRAAYISPDGSKVVSCYDKSDAIWWDLSLAPAVRATEVSGLKAHAELVAMSQDGMRVVLGSGCEVQVWDAASKDSRRLDVPGAADKGSDGEEVERTYVSCLATTDDGKYAAASGCQYINTASRYQPTRVWLCVWDLEEGGDAPLAVINLPDGQAPTALSISSDGRWVTAVTVQDRMWRWEVGSKVLGGPVVLDGAGSFGQSSISSDLRTAVACKDRQVQVWDLTTGTLTATLEGHTEELHAASISADGRRAVSSGDDCLVKVWDLESKTCLATLEGHNAGVREAALSTDGKHVVSATFTGVMRVWQLGV